MLNDSVHPAKFLPEGFKIGVSEIMVELCFVCSVNFIILTDRPTAAVTACFKHPTYAR
jgi:hypothetical protein